MGTVQDTLGEKILQRESGELLFEDYPGEYEYEDYSGDYEYEEYDSEDSGSFPKPSVAQPPHILGSSALSSLDSLFEEHLPGHLNTNLPLDLLTRLQNTQGTLPESETLNIILTPGTSQSQQPNIAILPTQDLSGFSDNIVGLCAFEH